MNSVRWTMMPPLQKPRVLLVDDHAAGRSALTRLLEMHNFDVTAVADGRSALLAMAELPPPHVVLTDYQLPDVDGCEVAAYAHALEPTPLVIMITGWNFSQDHLDSRKFGIDHVFLKPVDLASLVSTINDRS